MGPEGTWCPRIAYFSPIIKNEAVLFSHAKLKPVRELSLELLFASHAVFLGVFFLCFRPLVSFSRLGEGDTSVGWVSSRVTDTSASSLLHPGFIC